MATRIQRIRSRTRAIQIDDLLLKAIKERGCKELRVVEAMLTQLKSEDLRRVYYLQIGWPVYGAPKSWFVSELALHYVAQI